MTINTAKRATATIEANKLVKNKSRYLVIEKHTSVPWWVVAMIHKMECGGDFSLSIAQGDPWNRVSIRKPSGRGPFASFEDAAVDALGIDGTNKVKDWDVPRLCYELEKYNGWGYRLYHKATLSPYLWSFTNHYTRGKYTSDGAWDGAAVSGQTGAMAILKALMDSGAVSVTQSPPSGTSPAASATKVAPKPAPAPEGPQVPLKPSWFSAISKALTRKP